MKNTRYIMVFNRFERFWHWTQMMLIVTLLFTGFGIHGLHNLLDFETAVKIHTWSAIGLIVLWLFATFWLFTTGVWKHFLPTSKGLWQVIRFYAFGIFKGEHHPYRKAYLRKHNPLQALAYLSLKLIIFPALWISGLIYLSYNLWEYLPSSGLALEIVAIIHTAAAFAILVFIIVHVYMLTLGHSFIEHLKPMITGFDEVDLSSAEEAYIEESKTVAIKN